MSQHPSDPAAPAPFPHGPGVPTSRPLERFWPYAELPEEPTAEELAALDPDLHTALFGAPPGPFSVTLVFSPFDGPDYERALTLARKARDYREVGPESRRRHRATFHSSDAVALRELFRLVDRSDDCEVLVDGRPVPYARELWLPLIWFLIPH